MRNKTSRTKNTLINTFFGFFNKVINILSPFIIRTVMIYSLGIEYVGLNSLFSSILQILNLAELGISSAVVFCMYKPMADGDEDLLCAILNYMKKIYFVIGIIVAIIGVMLIPFFRFFINGSVPDNLNIIILYIIYLVNTVISYFFFTYKTTLLNADQKTGIISNINTGIIFTQSIIQIIILLVLKNYYLYLLVMPIFTFINNLWIAFITRRYYPNITNKGKLPSEYKANIKRRVKGLFVTRICTTTRNALDSIFISSFIGLATVGIYGNYYYIMSAIIGLISVITASMTASVGNSLVKESVEKNYNDMRKFNFLFNWIVGFCTCCLLVLYQPFMTIWMGKENLFSFDMVVLFCVYFYFLNIGSIRAVYHDAAGLWWEARYRAIIEAVLNLCLNFVLTYYFGVFGTVLGTLISLILVNYIYGTQIVFKYYFKNISSKQYYKDNFFYAVATVVICLILYIINMYIQINGIFGLLFKGLTCFIIFNSLYLVIFYNSYIFKECKKMLKNLFL